MLLQATEDASIKVQKKHSGRFYGSPSGILPKKLPGSANSKFRGTKFITNLLEWVNMSLLEH